MTMEELMVGLIGLLVFTVFLLIAALRQIISLEENNDELQQKLKLAVQRGDDLQKQIDVTYRDSAKMVLVEDAFGFLIEADKDDSQQWFDRARNDEIENGEYM